MTGFITPPSSERVGLHFWKVDAVIGTELIMAEDSSLVFLLVSNIL